MPQIDQIAATYASQIFWLLLTFGLTFFVIGIGMFPKIQGTVDARDQRIASDLEAARAANAQADELEETYRVKMERDRSDAAALVDKRRSESALVEEKRKAEADAEIGDTVAAAEAQIASAAQDAMVEIEQLAGELAQQLVTKVSGAKVTKAAAVKEAQSVMNAMKA